MASQTSFDSTKELLGDLLAGVKNGKTQLPDFQRDWVWDDERVRSLLASVSLSFPIGAVMMLQTGNEDVKFKPRPIVGVEGMEHHEPERLILDGQQRITSLYQVLYSGKVVHTRDLRHQEIRRWYYLDILKALDPSADREEAIIGVPESRVIKNFHGEVLADYSTPEKEYAAEVFPLHYVFNIAALLTWQQHYLQADPAQINQRLARWTTFFQDVIQRIQQYQIPVIVLHKATPREAVCQVFEKVNTGGVPLNVFQLLTATYAAYAEDDFRLRDDWAAREKRLKKHRSMAKVENTDFLQAVTLLSTRARRQSALHDGIAPDKAPAISCKRKDILRLSLDDYREWAEPATRGFENAAKLLASQCIYSAEDLPYQTQITPLAAILAILKDQAENAGVREKILRWYWCGVFGELYGGATESRSAKDLPEVLAWINGGPEPATIVDAHFAPARLLSLRTRLSAAYKGMYALLLRGGCEDFRTGLKIDLHTYFEEHIDIHHIFPQAWCKKNGIAPLACDSIINKTGISARTNRKIGGNAPSKYLTQMEKEASMTPGRMGEILTGHLIDPTAMRADHFDAFFEARRGALLSLIEKVMGKPFVPEIIEPEAVTEYEDDDEIEAAS